MKVTKKNRCQLEVEYTDYLMDDMDEKSVRQLARESIESSLAGLSTTELAMEIEENYPSLLED